MHSVSNLYKRSFNIGRGSEQIMNEKLHEQYTILEHYLDTIKEENDSDTAPSSKLDGAIWFDRKTKQLKWYDKLLDKWRPFYENELRLTSEMMSVLPPGDPVKGMLWIHQGVLCYWDGLEWSPIEALASNGTQFSLDTFKNFLFISPLWRVGEEVITDTELEAYKAALNGRAPETTTSFLDNNLNRRAQMIVPQIDYDRVFLNKDLNHEYEKITPVCIEYSIDKITENIPSLIHVNPARLSKVVKRIVLIDKANPKILISPANTEFYGFIGLTENNEINFGGELLLPNIDIQPSPWLPQHQYNVGARVIHGRNAYQCTAAHQSGDTFEGRRYVSGIDTQLWKRISTFEERDYFVLDDGILLTQSATDKYNFVLAVTYEFNWIHSSGSIETISNYEVRNAWHVKDFNGPAKVFIEGLDLEEPYFKTLSFDGNIVVEGAATNYDISVMHAPEREYGYIRQIDLQGRGVIRCLKKYKNPIIFVNGEIMHPILDQVVSDGNNFYVPGVKKNMAWSVTETSQTINDFQYDMFYSSGVVEDEDKNGNPCVKFNINDFENDGQKDVPILFVSGLLIKKEDLDTNYETGEITTRGLKLGQEYVLMRDRYGWLYDEASLTPAFPIDRFNESLVYMNGKLLCNNTSIDITDDPANIKKPAHNEVKCWINYDPQNRTETRSYWRYDSTTKSWKNLSTVNTKQLLGFCYAYRNASKSLELLIPYSEKDEIYLYAFRGSADIENPLIIGSINAEPDHPLLTIGNNTYWDEETQSELPFEDKGANRLKAYYLAGKETLSVWVNGVRIYPKTSKSAGFEESLDGMTFKLPEPVVGRITYIIERPEGNMDKPCTREVLGPDNIVPGFINIYKTENSLYPGRVTLYINGVRQSQDRFTLTDNHTIMIRGDEQLIGNKNNFPIETIVDSLGNKDEFKHEIGDYLLVEVHEDDGRQEKTIRPTEHPVQDIFVNNWDLPLEILESGDEILIFIDGLFYGATNDDGYVKNKGRLCITLTEPNIYTALNKDEKDELFTGNEEEKNNYLISHKLESYDQYDAEITFEWR